MSVLGSIAGAAIGAVGGILGNKSSAKEAQKSRDTSIEVAKNSHQWEVADLKAAGLNPILSANSGAHLSSLPSAGQSNPFSGIGDTYNSARKIDEVDKQALRIQDRAQRSQQDLNEASAGNQDALKHKSSAETNLANEQAALTRMSSINKIMERNTISMQQAALEAQAQRDYTSSQLNSALEASARATEQNTATRTKLSEREIRAGRYEEKTQQYTRPVRDIIETLTSPIRGLFHKSHNTTKLE